MGSVQTFSMGIILVWGGGWGEGAMWEDFSLEEFVLEEEKFNEGGARFSSNTIKKQQKNKHEKVFSTESKEQN